MEPVEEEQEKNDSFGQVEKKKSFCSDYGQNVNLRVTIQMFCLEQNGTYGIKCLELFFVGLRCCERRVRPRVHRWAAGK